jgi:hypothetical protein
LITDRERGIPQLGSLLDGDAEILVRSVMGGLAAGKADVAMFHCVPIDSAVYRVAARLPGFLWTDHVTDPQAHRIRDLSNMKALSLQACQAGNGPINGKGSVCCSMISGKRCVLIISTISPISTVL